MSSNAERLVAIRKQLDFTQSEMAAELGLSLRAYQALEAGESSVRAIHLLAAERVTLSNAVVRQNPMLALVEIRAEALELARQIKGS